VKTIVQTILYYTKVFTNFWVEWSGGQRVDSCIHEKLAGNGLTYLHFAGSVGASFGGPWLVCKMVFSSVLGGEEISKRRFGEQVRGEVRWEVRGER
jgi:hypothetical protein